jgi:VanZ family protein
MNEASTSRQPLRWFFLWFALGWCFVVWVIYQSLTPDPIETPGIEFGDKLGHFSAYFVMMAWFAQLYKAQRHVVCLISFVLLGVGLELIQGQTGYRVFEYADMAANSLGALMAWGLAKTSFATLLCRVEQCYLVR